MLVSNETYFSLLIGLWASYVCSSRPPYRDQMVPWNWPKSPPAAQNFMRKSTLFRLCTVRSSILINFCFMKFHDFWTFSWFNFLSILMINFAWFWIRFYDFWLIFDWSIFMILDDYWFILILIFSHARVLY